MKANDLKVLSNKIIKIIGEQYAGDVELIIDDVQYALDEVEEADWDDQGKYSNGYSVYQVGIADKNHPYKTSSTLDIFLYQDTTRYGDYYQGYDTEYKEPYRVKKVERKIIVTDWKAI